MNPIPQGYIPISNRLQRACLLRGPAGRLYVANWRGCRGSNPHPLGAPVFEAGCRTDTADTPITTVAAEGGYPQRLLRDERLELWCAMRRMGRACAMRATYRRPSPLAITKW